MLHYVHQLVTNCVCCLVLIKSGVQFSDFRAFLLKAAAGNHVYESCDTELKSKAAMLQK